MLRSEERKEQEEVGLRRWTRDQYGGKDGCCSSRTDKNNLDPGELGIARPGARGRGERM